MRQLVIAILSFIAMLVMTFVLHAVAQNVAQDDEATVGHTRLSNVGEAQLVCDDADELFISSSFGDIEIEGANVHSAEFTFSYFEYEPGDATFYFDEGELKYRTKSGKPASLRYLEGRVPQTADLTVDIGMGSLLLSGMDDAGELTIECGSGEVELENCENIGELTVHTGMGDITLRKLMNVRDVTLESGTSDAAILSCIDLEEVDVSLGMGDLLLSDTHGGEYDVSCGTGDVMLRQSHIHDLDVSTGMGDLIVSESHVDRQRFDTGMGRLRNEKPRAEDN